MKSSLHEQIQRALDMETSAKAEVARTLGLTRQAYHQSLLRGLTPERGLIAALLAAGCAVTLRPGGGVEVTRP